MLDSEESGLGGVKGEETRLNLKSSSEREVAFLGEGMGDVWKGFLL